MYRMAVVGIFVIVAVIIAADLARRFLSHGSHRPPVEGLHSSRIIRLLRLGVAAAGVAFLVAAAITGFIPVIERQPSLSGYLLMIHVTTAGGFAVASVAVALVWVSRNRFTEMRWENTQAEVESPLAVLSGAVLLRKSSFWFALAFAVPTLGTALLAMFPLASPAQQQELLLIHRICALALTASGVLFAYSALVDNWNVRKG